MWLKEETQAERGKRTREAGRQTAGTAVSENERAAQEQMQRGGCDATLGLGLTLPVWVEAPHV